jgi:repressor LexA
MKELTKRQKAVMDFINREVRKKRIPPSIREIGKELEISSPRGVTRHLEALEKKGFIHRGRIARGIRILADTAGELVNLPLVGRIAAGKPLLAEENLDGSFSVDKSFVPSGRCFCLKVNGESMVGAGILDGDFVIVRQQSTAENGEIVVALLGDEATVKRFYREKGKIRLQPENPLMDPILVTGSKRDVSILGKVVGVFRKI